MATAMAIIYYNLIKSEKRTIEQVLKNLQPAVKADLEAMGLDENGNPIEA